MPPSPRKKTRDADRLPVWLIGAEDDFLVQSEARRILERFLGKEPAAESLEIVETESSAASDLLGLLRRVDEALSTPSLFAERKMVWLRRFAAVSRQGRPKSKPLMDALKDLAVRIRTDPWPAETGLLITGGPPDRALALVKAVGERGELIAPGGGKGADSDRALGDFVTDRLRADECTIEPAALRRFLSTVGSDRRRLASETEKLVLYVGPGGRITEEDVARIASSGAEPPVWDLADAFAERRLADAIALVETFLQRGESAVGIVAGLVQRVRLLAAMRPLVAARMLDPREPFPRFRARLDRLPEDLRESYPDDRRLNPFAHHPFVLYKVCGQSMRFTQEELDRAFDLLIAANRELVSSGSGRERLILQKTLIRALGAPSGTRA